MKKLFVVLIVCGLALTASAQTSPRLNLLWSAQTYSPPFYQGHSQASPQSPVRLIAQLSGVSADPATLNYNWRRDNQALAKSSGLGRNSLSFSAGQLGDTHEIELEVTSGSGTLKLKAQAEIPVTRPEISFYQDEP